MNKLIVILFASFCILGCSCKQQPEVTPDPVVEPVAVQKTNDTRVFMHYMPWFHSKDYSGYWGSHWRMDNANPEYTLGNGNLHIASHYYPLIGPYDSSDPDVIDYHLLLMKYTGIDGVLIDWYGSHDVLDYGTNLGNSNALISGIKRVGLEYAVVYEEFTAEEVARRRSFSALEAAQRDMAYLESNYFSDEEYIQIAGSPLMLTFGPRYFRSSSQWSQILMELGQSPTFLPLWDHRSLVGTSNSSGEFSWVDFNSNQSHLSSFYQGAGSSMIIGSAYPGFHDFYEEGGWGDSYGYLDHANGATLQKTLDLATQYDLPYLQLVTWNDFGEGTMFEPTQEFEYQYLEMVQDFAGVTYDREDLELIHTYYLKRKELDGNSSAQNTLDEAFDALIQLDVDKARNLLNRL